MRRRLAWLALAGLLTLTAAAAPVTRQVDVNHAWVTFKIRHLGLAWVRGAFDELGGKIVFEPDAPEQASVELIVQAKSVDTGIDARDEHLRKPDFFDVERYPTIRFKSTKIEPIEGNRYKVTGDLTLLAVTRPITVEGLFEGRLTDQRGTERLGFTSEFTIKRSEWGLSYGLPAIGDEVTLEVSFEAIPE